MNIQSVKLSLLERVLKTENPKILQQMLSIVKSEKEKEDFWVKLSAGEKKEIMEGLEQLDKGQRVSYESVMKKFRK